MGPQTHPVAPKDPSTAVPIATKLTDHYLTIHGFTPPTTMPNTHHPRTFQEYNNLLNPWESELLKHAHFTDDPFTIMECFGCTTTL